MNQITLRLLMTLLLIDYGTVSAQRAAVLAFRETTRDFGNITEHGGAVEHEFVFTNNLGKNIKIANVETSCGCTSPSWTRDAVAPGGTGRITVRYDPKGRPGFFSKTITVTTDPITGSYGLIVKGNVVEKQTETRDGGELTDIQGNLRTAASVVAFGKIYLNRDPVQKSIGVFNGGSATIRFLKSSGPEYLRITTPTSLKPGERGQFVIRYDASKRGTYGLATDQVTLVTSDDQVPEKHFQVMASLEEYFEPVPADRLKQVPRLIISDSGIDLGEMTTGTTAERQIQLINIGKQQLLIRTAIPNCTCLTIEGLPETIAPGKSVPLTIRFNSGERNGRQMKSVMIYSTDPVKPVQRITVSAQLP